MDERLVARMAGKFFGNARSANGARGRCAGGLSAGWRRVRLPGGVGGWRGRSGQGVVFGVGVAKPLSCPSGGGGGKRCATKQCNATME